MKIHRFEGVNEQTERNLQLMLATLHWFDQQQRRRSEEIGQPAGPEIEEIVTDGVTKFEAASAGCAPAQRVMVGVRYTLGALREWAETGPLGPEEGTGESQKDVKSERSE